MLRLNKYLNYLTPGVGWTAEQSKSSRFQNRVPSIPKLRMLDVLTTRRSLLNFHFCFEVHLGDLLPYCQKSNLKSGQRVRSSESQCHHYVEEMWICSSHLSQVILRDNFWNVFGSGYSFTMKTGKLKGTKSSYKAPGESRAEWAQDRC